MYHCTLLWGEQTGHGHTEEKATFILRPWRELRVIHTTCQQPNWPGGVCFHPTACSYLWQRNTRLLLQKPGTAFCHHKCYRGGPTGDVAFTSDLHANEKNLSKILVALVRAELWDVFQHCSPLVMQENHITFTFLLHIQHPGKVVSQSQLVAGVSLFN